MRGEERGRTASERAPLSSSTIQIADYAPGFYVPSNWAASALGKDRPIARPALVNPQRSPCTPGIRT